MNRGNNFEGQSFPPSKLWDGSNIPKMQDMLLLEGRGKRKKKNRTCSVV